MSKENLTAARASKMGAVGRIYERIKLYPDPNQREGLRDAANLAKTEAGGVGLEDDARIRNEVEIKKVKDRISGKMADRRYNQAFAEGQGLIAMYAETIRFRSSAIANPELVAARAFTKMIHYSEDLTLI